MKYYTRSEYMSDSQHAGPEVSAAHRRYFGQFVNYNTKHAVLSAIGLKALLTSTNPHFNDIPLDKWYSIVPKLSGSGGFEKAGDFYTKANGVCLAKEAARQIVEAQLEVDADPLRALEKLLINNGYAQSKVTQ